MHWGPMKVLYPQDQDLGSGPTIQSYITKLVLKEMITRKVSEEDKRIQYPIPTENAINLFKQLNSQSN